MKILHVCAIGITAKNLLKPQIDYFLTQGCEVEVVCSDGVEAEELRRAGYVIHAVPIEREMISLTNLVSIAKLVRLMRQQQYDIVHVHTPIAAVLGRIAAKISGIKGIVYTSHGLPFHDRSSPLAYQLFAAVEKSCGWLTDLLLSQNHEDVMTARQLRLCPAEKIAYLGNGIDIARFDRRRLNLTQQAELRRSLGIPDSAKLIIGTVGRLTYKKGSSYLIEAAAQLLPAFPHLHILVIGGQLASDPQPFETQLLDQIHGLGLADHVTLTGYRDDIPELLGLLDIFTLPTFTHEGLPRSILEAMGLELPVVTTDIRGCREAVVHGKTGLIVPPENSQKLAEALWSLLADEPRRQRYGQAGRQRLETLYDERFVFERLADSYQDLMQKQVSQLYESV